jgi:hypothetical protein
VIKTYKSIILPTVYMGVKQSFTLRDIKTVRAQSAEEDIWTQDHGKLHNKKLYDLYSWYNIVRATK